uniref:Membrane protein n=1 Tax=Micrococcus phage Kurnik TaxID=3092208 RepID=A0AAU6R778_9CAUD
MDGTQILAWGGILLGGGSGIFVIIKTIIDKYGKGTTDRQTEVEFGVGILQQQITKSAEDSKRWLEVETYLRDELRRSNADTERVQGLLDVAREQIDTLRRERDELLARQALLVAKFTRGEQITLADITGQSALDRELDELEDTFTA